MQPLAIETIAAHRIVPVVVLEDCESAVPLAETLLAAGLGLIEITFRTAAAAESIARIRDRVPGIVVGAGTILSEADLERAAEAGARFAVAPGLNESVATAAGERGLLFIPGVMTPSEIERALALGLRLLKFFPAGAAGGVSMLKALAGPYGHTGVKFVPTGGVTAANLAEYLALPVVAAVGGSWLAESKLLKTRDWAAIKVLTAEAVRVAGRFPACV